MPKPTKIDIIDLNDNIIKSYTSKNKCAKDFELTTYKLNQYILNNTIINGVRFYSDDIPSNYTKVECGYCGKAFFCLNSRIERSSNVYCSTECRDRASEGEPNCECPICGTKFHIEESRINKSKNHYCSVGCHIKAKSEYMKGENNHQYGLIGSLNSSWKTGELISNYGYRLIRVYDHPFKSESGMVFEHRLVAEKYLLTEENSIEINGKRYLKPEFVVHHINYDRLDNRVENLVVMLRSEHTALHARLRNNFLEFEQYCIDNKIDFEKTYKQYLYNVEHYGHETILSSTER